MTYKLTKLDIFTVKVYVIKTHSKSISSRTGLIGFTGNYLFLLQYICIFPYNK